MTLAMGPTPHEAAAQQPADSLPRPRPGSQLRLPLSNLLVPGLGQFLYGDVAAGLAFSGSAATGIALYLTGDTAAVSTKQLPRHPGGQQAFAGVLLLAGSAELSAYDSFRRALPALQYHGKYRFIRRSEPMSALFTAPFDPRFLSRWTTWIELAYTAGITTLVLSERDPDVRYEPFRVRDGAFVTGLSLSAAVGEEAMFRGWIFPVLHENLGQRFLLSNGIQAAIFGALHVPQAGEFAAVIAAWAFYEGWLTRRNGWSFRESIFHHFWYNVAVATATMLTDERTTVAVTAPPIHF